MGEQKTLIFLQKNLFFKKKLKKIDKELKNSLNNRVFSLKSMNNFKTMGEKLYRFMSQKRQYYE